MGKKRKLVDATLLLANQNRLNWLMDTSTRVNYGGLPAASFATNGVYAGVYTIINVMNAQKIRQWGYVRQVKCYITATGSGFIKFKVFRKNGSNYDMVSESEQITPAGTGTQTYNLATPMACKPDDFIGVYISHASTQVAYTNLTGTANARYVAGDITTSNAFSSSSNNIQINIEPLGISPYFAVTGDSVAEGHAAYASIYDGTASANLPIAWCEQLRGLISTDQDGGFEYQNHGADVKTWAWVLSTGMPAALATGAKTIFINCGLNDIDTARTWAAVLSDINATKVLFDASSTAEKLLIGEITPSSNFDDTEAATVRTWNASLAAWCAANGARLISLHDVLASIRGTTSELDDLSATYDSGDGVHLNEAGHGVYAAQVKPGL